MLKFRMLRVLALALALPGGARADLPELFGNLQIPSTLPSMVEDSADLIIQVPRQIDPASPVPVRIRVLQSPVAAITLLSDAVDPVQLASFDFQPGVDAQVATRFMSAEVAGVLVVVRTATNRIFAGRRTFELVSQTSAVPLAADNTPVSDSEAVPAAFAASAAASSVASAVVSSAASSEESAADTMEPELRLDAVMVREDSTRVTLRAAQPLVQRMQKEALSVSNNPVSRFELKHKERVLVSAELDAAMWSDPFFSFSFTGGKPGDSLTLSWEHADGEQGELQTTINPGG